MTISRDTLFQIFKYTVYVLLAMNVYWFFALEHAAAKVQFPDGVAWQDLKVAYVAAIDTAAWVVLLLMFELETYVLDDKHFTKPVVWGLHGLRIVCYAFIVSAFIDYINSLVFVQSVTPLTGVDNLCALVSQQWSYAAGFDDYVAISTGNCASLSPASAFVVFEETQAVVDLPGHAAIVRLGWVDVINSGVWLLVVMVLEIDVRLQEHNRYEGLALKVSNALKGVLYSLLLCAAVYWGIEGDFVDFWDAFLWLVAFVFIELNVFEWRQEELQAQG
ncbi:MAG: hypothetical protein GWN47_00630 [Woeseiaceae bacterium]|nr:hypothetical protein [Woeseiaceae bacterium]